MFRGKYIALYIHVVPKTQCLLLINSKDIVKRYTISTAAKGLGELLHSEKTPRGWHQIRAKIGADQPLNAVFDARRPTGEIYSADLAKKYPDRIWILTRILWLSGLEPGKNKFGDVDSMRRYIYIHGSPDELPIGVPNSRGCIHMRNVELVELFDIVIPGTKIYIEGLDYGVF